MHTYKMITETFGSMSKYSKTIIKYGAIYLLALVTAAVSLNIVAGILVNYYTAMDLSQQLFNCLNPSVGIMGLGVFLFEYACKKYVEDT